VADTPEVEKAAQAPKPETAPPEEDILFKIQTSLSDFVTDNAKYFGYVVGAILFAALCYGAYQSYRTSTLEDDFGAIAQIDYKMPKPNPLAAMGFGPADDPSDAGRMKDLQTGAELYEKAAMDASGSAAGLAWSRAADAWKRAGNEEKRMAALEKAASAGAPDAVGFAAKMSLVNVLLDKGENDKALQILLEESQKREGVLGQEAYATLIRTQVALGKTEEAKTSFAAFKQKFPQATRSDLEGLGLESGS
jgi:predicted negative regulator of RcsB-dependent stress response